jgi:transposase
VSEIASHLNCASNTIRQTFYRWLSQGIEGLFDAPRSGRAKKWNSEDIKFLENCLSQEQRTYKNINLRVIFSDGTETYANSISIILPF